MEPSVSDQRLLRVPSESQGTRLDVFICRSCGGISRSRVQRLIEDGSVTVNGRAALKKYPVSAGDEIRVAELRTVPGPPLPGPEDIPLSVIYEDDFFCAIDKPAGLVVHPGSGNRSGTLVNALLFRGGNLSSGSAPDRPGIVHRLDKETSGVVVVAKTGEAHAAIAAEFARRAVHKTYLGFCFGEPPAGRGTIDLPLARSRANPVKRAPDGRGKASQTEFLGIDFRHGVSLVAFMPRTGRTHQIRVHCSSRGFPIVCDELYGGGKKRLERCPPADRPFCAKVYLCFSRHALHARSLSFRHPFLGKTMTLQAPYPPDFRKALELFGRSADFDPSPGGTTSRLR